MEFNGTTKIGFPVGVNVLYSDRFGFSYEFTPTITATKTISKMSNLLFDPGTMFRFDHGFTVITVWLSKFPAGMALRRCLTRFMPEPNMSITLSQVHFRHGLATEHLLLSGLMFSSALLLTNSMNHPEGQIYPCLQRFG